MSAIRKLVVGIAALAGAYVLLVVGYVFWPDVRDYVFPEPFDAECWRTGAMGIFALDEAECSRWRMRHSLLRKHALVGMHRAEVERLLGPEGYPDDEVISYSLGPSERGINYGVLELRLDESSKVESIRIYEH